MKNIFCKVCILFSLVGIAQNKGLAQASSIVDIQGKDTPRPINTAVPFLTISPDARSGALGDVGAALTPDANATHWNVSRLAFMDKSFGGAISYTPWLRKLVPDMSISYLTGYYKLSKEQAIAFSLTYFNLGELQFTTGPNDPGMLYKPKEYAPMLSYARKLSQNFSVGVSAKFIYSNLAGSIPNASSGQGDGVKAGVAGAVDVGVYYKKDILVGGKNSNIALGANISDIGSKITYTTGANKQFIPTNLRVGVAYTTEIDPYNKFTFIVDANKMMVPTQPLYGTDTSGGQSKQVIVSGKDPKDIPLLQGIFGSFSDAPGGFKEELREITLSAAIEYWYNDLFAIRGGTFNESKYKGNRKYMTLGFGVRYKDFGLDFAYLVPFVRNNPLAETLRFSLHFNFEGKRQESVTE